MASRIIPWQLNNQRKNLGAIDYRVLFDAQCFRSNKKKKKRGGRGHGKKSEEEIM